MNEKPYPKWVGVALGFVLSGSAHYLSGERSAGVSWYLAIALTEMAGIAFLALPGAAGRVLAAAFLLGASASWLAMLKTSYRPVRRIGFRGWLAVIALNLALSSAWSFAASRFVCPFKISTGAMAPNLLPGDHVVADRISYRFAAPRRGDVVVFSTSRLRHPHVQPDTFYVKRIAGLPGETLRIDPPHLLVDGNVVHEPPVFAEIASGSNGFRLAGGILNAKAVLAATSDTLVLGDDEYLTLGDNTPSSLDGRHYGPVRGDQIVGRVSQIYWPPSRIGKWTGAGRADP